VKIKLLIIGYFLVNNFIAAIADEKKVWLELLESTDIFTQESLLAEGVSAGLGLPENWRSLWKKEPLQPWLLQVLPYKLMAELPPLSEWSVSLRLQVWQKAITENWGGEDLLLQAQKSGVGLDENEQALVHHLLKKIPPEWKEPPYSTDSDLMIYYKWSTAKSFSEEAQKIFAQSVQKLSDHQKMVVPEVLSDETIVEYLKSKDQQIVLGAYREKWKRKLDWPEIMKKLKEYSWPMVDTVVDVLSFHKMEINGEQFISAWSSQDEAGRFALGLWASTVEHTILSDFLCAELIKDNSSQLCLCLLQSMGPHQKSDWLLDQLSSHKIAKDNIEKCLSVLLSWDEVKPDRRYVEIYLNDGYRKGGLGGDDLLLLMGKSQHADAEKIIASHFKESETNPYSLDIVVEASAYHGSDKLLRQIKAALGEHPDEFYQWAIDRSEKKISSDWKDSNKEPQGKPRSFREISKP
jgi:hypothetical protein